MIISIKRDLLYAVVITVIASILGLATNTARTPILAALAERGTIHPTQYNTYKGVRLIDNWSHGGWERAKDSENAPEGKRIKWIDYYQLMELNKTGGIRFIDARVLKEYDAGHIPGAIPWPFNEFLEYLVKYHDDIPFNAPVVVYCEGGTCDQSVSLAENLQIVGYADIYIYHGGFDEWKNMGMPVEQGEYR
jgi:rhodanese-related sulfurtransferase